MIHYEQLTDDMLIDMLKKCVGGNEEIETQLRNFYETMYFDYQRYAIALLTIVIQLRTLDVTTKQKDFVFGQRSSNDPFYHICNVHKGNTDSMRLIANHLIYLRNELSKHKKLLMEIEQIMIKSI